MRKRDKLKNYEQANLMLEQSYLKSKGFLKINILTEEVDTPKFESFLTKLAENYKFVLKSGEQLSNNQFTNALKNNATNLLGEFDKKNNRYEKEGLVYAGKYQASNTIVYDIFVATTNKALIKRIQKNVIDNYSKFTSGKYSESMGVGKSATVDIDKSEEGKLFFDFVNKLIDSNKDIGGAGMDLKLNDVKNYIKNKGMEGKKMYVGLIPGDFKNRDRVMIAYSDEKTYKDFIGKLLSKFNRLKPHQEVVQKDNENNDIKIVTIPIYDENINTKYTAKGSQGTMAVQKTYGESNKSSIESFKTKEGVDIFYTGRPFHIV